jgi:hypothetical protein
MLTKVQASRISPAGDFHIYYCGGIALQFPPDIPFLYSFHLQLERNGAQLLSKTPTHVSETTLSMLPAPPILANALCTGLPAHMIRIIQTGNALLPLEDGVGHFLAF